MSNLNFDQVAANQNQKEVTINDAFDQVDDALTEHLTVDLSAADVALTADQWTRNWFFEMSGHTVARTVTLPPTKRPAVVKNGGTGAVTLQVSGGGTAVIQPAQTVMVYNDSVNLTAVGGGASAFTGLADTFASYAGKANQIVRVNSTEDGLTVDNYWESPVLGDFDIYDLSATSSYIQTRDGIALSTPNNGGRPLTCLYKKPLPANWTFEVELQNSILAANYQSVHVGVGAVSDQSQFTVGENNNVGWWKHKMVGGMTSGTGVESLGATVTNLISVSLTYLGVPYVTRVSYNAGTLTFDLSVDGGNTYRNIYSVSISAVYSAVPTDLMPVISLANSSGNPVYTLIRKYRLQALP